METTTGAHCSGQVFLYEIAGLGDVVTFIEVLDSKVYSVVVELDAQRPGGQPHCGHHGNQDNCGHSKSPGQRGFRASILAEMI